MVAAVLIVSRVTVSIQDPGEIEQVSSNQNR